MIMQHNPRRFALSLVACAASLIWAAGTAAALAVTSDSGISFSGDALYWRPSGLNARITAPTPLSAVPSPGQAEGIHFGFAPGYRLQADWQDWRVSWLDLQTKDDFSAACPTGLCFSAPLVGVPISGAAASSDVRLQVADLEFRQPLADYSESSKRTFTWALGARFARLTNDTATSYQDFGAVPGPVFNTQSRAVNNLWGAHSEVEGKYAISSAFTASGKIGFSLMDGRSDFHMAGVESGGGIGTQYVEYRTAADDIVPIWELGARLTYSPLKDLELSAGYDFMEFSEVFLKPILPTGTLLDEGLSQTVSFQGPRAGFSWRFE